VADFMSQLNLSHMLGLNDLHYGVDDEGVAEEEDEVEVSGGP
jgi:hypothetical protein